MFTKTFDPFQIICGFLVIFTLAGTVHGQGLSPAHEQEFIDAKAAIEAAQTVKADKYAPDRLKEAKEFLSEAEDARLQKNDVQFSQASHMARALAESAKASSELKLEQERLSATQVELQKVKADIQRLEKAK